MKRQMICTACASILLCAVFGICRLLFQTELWLTLAITCGTIAYHFLMRLGVGWLFHKCMNNHADDTRRWFRVSAAELRFYQKIKVKKWKQYLPTYAPDNFSPNTHTWSEISQAMCQAELVHETIIVFSFLPLLLASRWGAFGVFFLTSAAASGVDFLFVIMQRYNRVRIQKLKKYKKGNQKEYAEK